MLKQVEVPQSEVRRKQIAVRENGSARVVVYEVPPGKTFEGIAYAQGSNGYVSVNGVTVASGSSGHTPIKLVTGAVVSASYGGGIVGIEQ